MAEIVLCAVDVALQKAHPGIEGRCMRFMDDIEFFASTQSEAEDVLLTWQSLLADYELMVNPTKTAINEEPWPLEKTWRTTLAHFTFRDGTDTKRANDLLSFFSIAFDLARSHRQEYVLSYATSIATHLAIGVRSWRVLQDLLVAAGTIEPSCLSFVAGALGKSVTDGVPLQPRRLSESMNHICEYHAQREHGSEVTWALWILRRFGLRLTAEAAAQVAGMQDNCALLLLLDAVGAGRVDGAIPDLTAVIARAEAPDAWRSSDWLLGYESCRNGWASDTTFRKQPHWNELLKKGVAFFRPAATASSVDPTGTRVRAGTTGRMGEAEPAPAADVVPSVDPPKLTVDIGRQVGTVAEALVIPISLDGPEVANRLESPSERTVSSQAPVEPRSADDAEEDGDQWWSDLITADSGYPAR